MISIRYGHLYIMRQEYTTRKKKNQYLLKRLRIRIHATRSATFLDYYTNHLLCDANEEVSHFIQEITVNETYFF